MAASTMRCGKIMAKKLIEFEREEFIHEITENWDRWKRGTTLEQLRAYMIQKAFTKKSDGTLKPLSKDQLREIIIKGDEEPIKDSPTLNKNFGSEAMDFLEDVKHDLHQEKMNPFVKKLAVKQIDKNIIEPMTDTITHRGPDGFGYYYG